MKENRFKVKIMPHWKTKYNPLISLILALFFWTNAYANQPDILSTLSLPKVMPVEQAFVFNLTQTQTGLQAQWHISPHTYLYQDKLQITQILSNGEEIPLLQKAELPPAKKVDDHYFGEQSIYLETLTILITPQITSSKEQFFIQVNYQGCSETGFCYPPSTKWYEVNVSNHNIQTVSLLTNAPVIEANKNTSAFDMTNMPNLSEAQTQHHIPTTIATFYFIGILLAFTPCVLPMIPILFGVIVGQRHLNTRKAFWLSLCYVLSMAFTYAIAGLIAATLGKNLQAQLQKPAVIISFAALFVYLGLAQLGVLRISFGQYFLKDLLHKFHTKQESGTYLGAIIMGILATLISSPCVSAPLIGALSFISQTGNVVLGMSALLALGLGMGTVLLLIGTLGGKYFPKSGPWMHAVNQIFAVVMFGLSLWLIARVFHHAWLLFFWGLLCLFIAKCMKTFQARSGWSGRVGALFVAYALILFWGAWQGENDPLKPLANPWRQTTQSVSAHSLNFQNIGSVSALESVQTQAQKEAQPFLVVFYADWCTSCKHLEREVFDDPIVQQRLKSWDLLRADVTQYNEANQLLLKKFGLIGPPAVLFFDKKGNELTKYRIVGESSAKHFLTQIDQVENKIEGT